MPARLLYFFLLCSSLAACNLPKNIRRTAEKDMVMADPLRAAHVGISIFEPATGKYWYNYQGDRFFVPASNTKIPTCYAAMKYLGDSLEAAHILEYPNDLLLFPTGDPTLLHEDFSRQPLRNLLVNTSKTIHYADTAWHEQALGSGWAWNDYADDYMAERSALPVYGNLVHTVGRTDSVAIVPSSFAAFFVSGRDASNSYINSVQRSLASNQFVAQYGARAPVLIGTPFVTSDSLNLSLLLESSHHSCNGCMVSSSKDGRQWSNQRLLKAYVLHSQPTDSLLAPMMHRSDNFFAEQSLLMVSNKLLHVFSDEKIIDTLLKTDFKDLPQIPRWVDGSGLSRYNLFTPQDFVTILNKMRTDFGMERLKVIFPTGGTGTLSRYYRADAGYIFAKTGSLNGVVSLSGFLYTRKNKLLIFSILVNNATTSPTLIRKAEEKFLETIRSKY